MRNRRQLANGQAMMFRNAERSPLCNLVLYLTSTSGCATRKMFARLAHARLLSRNAPEITPEGVAKQAPKLTISREQVGYFC